MKGNAKTRWLVVLVMLWARPALAEEAAKVSWHQNVQDAWTATQRQGRPMLVFVTRADCYYCTVMKDRTWSHATVAGAINQSFVPLVLDGGQATPLLKELNVTAYPSTFIISPQAVILDRIDGYVSPEALAQRLQIRNRQTAMNPIKRD